MTRQRSKKRLIVTLILVAAFLVAVGGIATVVNNLRPDDSYVTPTTNDDTDEATDLPLEETPVEETPAEDVPTADPETTSSIDIEPMGITVYYVKGISGFGFSVERAGNGTQYVQFSSEELVGTKCTDDEGVFASIVLNPSDVEEQSLAKTKVIGEDTYGLSLADNSCTSDDKLLDEYQMSFINAFTYLDVISDENES